jgi:hypothetical protein
VGGLKTYEQLLIGVGITTFSWIIVTLFTKPSSIEKLRGFYRLVRPGGPGWRKVVTNSDELKKMMDSKGDETNLPIGILSMFVGCIAVYGFLFATGYWLYANYLNGIILTIVTLISLTILFHLWRKLNSRK